MLAIVFALMSAMLEAPAPPDMEALPPPIREAPAPVEAEVAVWVWSKRAA
jgi:hypothetical protein